MLIILQRKWNKLWILIAAKRHVLFWESCARYKKLWEKRTRRNNSSTYGKLEIVFSRVWALKHPPLAPILHRGQWSIKRDPHIAKNHDMKSSMSKMTSCSIRWGSNSSFAPLESPKFAWHHHQTLDTYTIFFPFWRENSKFLPDWLVIQRRDHK